MHPQLRRHHQVSMKLWPIWVACVVFWHDDVSVKIASLHFWSQSFADLSNIGGPKINANAETHSRFEETKITDSFRLHFQLNDKNLSFQHKNKIRNTCNPKDHFHFFRGNSHQDHTREPADVQSIDVLM